MQRLQEALNQDETNTF